MTLLKDYYKEEVLEPNHVLRSLELQNSPDGKWEDYIKYIEALPLTVEPEVFAFMKTPT